MGFGEDSPDDDEWLPLDTGHPTTERVWQHPSEVGAATRGTADRRRSTLIASGVLIGGIGLLLTSLVMGTTRARPLEVAEATATTLPGAVATVTYTGHDDRPAALPGLLVDDSGHLLVPVGGEDGPLAGADDVPRMWVSARGGGEQATELVGVDRAKGLAVLRAPSTLGVAAPSGAPETGDELAVVAAGRFGPSLSGWVEVTRTPRRGGGIELLGGSSEERDSDLGVSVVEGELPAGALLFDHRGDFAGLTLQRGSSGTGTSDSEDPADGDEPLVLGAPEAVDAALRLISDAG